MSSYKSKRPAQKCSGRLFLRFILQCRYFLIILKSVTIVVIVRCAFFTCDGKFDGYLGVDDVYRLARGAFDLKLERTLCHILVNSRDFAEFVRTSRTTHPKRIAVFSDYGVAIYLLFVFGFLFWLSCNRRIFFFCHKNPSLRFRAYKFTFGAPK